MIKKSNKRRDFYGEFLVALVVILFFAFNEGAKEAFCYKATSDGYSFTERLRR